MILRFLSAALLLAGCSPQLDGAPRFFAAGAPIGDYSLPTQSMTEARFSGAIRQKYDFSCGSAALATLLRFHYGYDVGEEKAFRGMWATGNQEQIRKVGFSLLDMKRWLARRGLTGEGYEVGLDKIEKTGLPGIVLIKVKNYRHFVVLKGVRRGEVLLGDPAMGLTTMTRAEFEQSWNGVYFVISQDRARAQATFDRDQQWAAYTRAPVGNSFSDPLSQQALMLTAPFYGDIS